MYTTVTFLAVNHGNNVFLHSVDILTIPVFVEIGDLTLTTSSSYGLVIRIPDPQ